ncbi:MAG: indolepyruvate ferredoxin oxidoreductase subunit alpha [Nitrospirota bacterium]
MSFVILQDQCIACGACREECPSDAIEPSGAAFRIITDKCIECASCMENCPSGAIVED